MFGAAEELASEQIRRQIDTNLLGSIDVIRTAVPHLRAQGGGRILQVSSEGGQYAYPGYGLYHATKFGIEGFVDAVAQETASFGIRFTLAEPGPTRTNFGSSRVAAAPIPVYESTPVGDLRKRMAEGRFAAKTGDADKVVQAMIDAMDREPPPRRITLGSIAYDHIETTLADKLAALRAQRNWPIRSTPNSVHGVVAHVCRGENRTAFAIRAVNGIQLVDVRRSAARRPA